MFARFASSSSAAVVITGGLLLLMATLIAQQGAPLRHSGVHRLQPWIEPQRDPPEVITRDRPEEPREIDPHPPRPQMEPTGPTIPVVGTGPQPFEPPSGSGGLRLGIADGELMAIVTVAPAYPPAAERRNLEGYVIVEFLVTANGSVDNVRVTESTHMVFERAAIEAAGKFRFRPRVVDGEPVAVDGVRRRITFTLQD